MIRSSVFPSVEVLVSSGYELFTETIPSGISICQDLVSFSLYSDLWKDFISSEMLLVRLSLVQTGNPLPSSSLLYNPRDSEWRSLYFPGMLCGGCNGRLWLWRASWRRCPLVLKYHAPLTLPPHWFLWSQYAQLAGASSACESCLPNLPSADSSSFGSQLCVTTLKVPSMISISNLCPYPIPGPAHATP